MSLPRVEPLTLQPVTQSLYGLHYPRSHDGDEPRNVPASGDKTVYHTLTPSNPPIPLSSHGTMFIRFRCHNLHKSEESTGSAGRNTPLPPQTIFPQEPPSYISCSVFKPKTLSFKPPSRIRDLLVVVAVVVVVVAAAVAVFVVVAAVVVVAVVVVVVVLVFILYNEDWLMRTYEMCLYRDSCVT